MNESRQNVSFRLENWQESYMRPRTLKEAVQRTLLSGDERIHIFEFLDEFYLRHGNAAEQLVMISDPPPMSGKQPFDAYVGAVGEHLARRWGLPAIPLWVEEESRFLTTPFWDDDLQLMKVILLRDSPIAFRRRLIFTEAEPLRRGRFPVRVTPCP